tara:strand:+ start:277 stop:483 length:207 start_codon:yes stop_codon:yes gene_type:complete
VIDDDDLITNAVRKFIPYLLFSATTLHTVLGNSPVMAMECDSHSEKINLICEESDVDCNEKFSTSNIN